MHVSCAHRNMERACNLIASGHADGSVRLWEVALVPAVKRGRVVAGAANYEWGKWRLVRIAVLSGAHAAPVSAVAFTPDYCSLWSGDARGEATRWAVGDRASYAGNALPHVRGMALQKDDEEEKPAAASSSESRNRVE